MVGFDHLEGLFEIKWFYDSEVSKSLDWWLTQLFLVWDAVWLGKSITVPKGGILSKGSIRDSSFILFRTLCYCNHPGIYWSRFSALCCILRLIKLCFLHWQFNRENRLTPHKYFMGYFLIKESYPTEHIF